MPSGSSRHVDARSTSVWRAASRGPATTTRQPRHGTSGQCVLDLADVVGRHEHDRRFPRLAAGHPRAQRERRLGRQGRAPEERRGEVERGVERITPNVVAVTDERRRIQPDPDQLRDLGEHRGAECGGDRGDDGVGAVGLGIDGQNRERFEIDVEIA